MKEKYSSFLKQSSKDYRFWIKLVLGIGPLLSILICITDAYIRSVIAGGKGYYSIIVNLSFFTTLSNLFCGFFFLQSACYHHLEGRGKFNNDEVAKMAVTYIAMTLFIFNLSELTGPDPYQFVFYTKWISLIFEHSLVPLGAILYYIFLYDHRYAKDMKDFSRRQLWYVISGLVAYGVFFWIFGMLSKYSGRAGLYTWNGTSAHFVYPFLDFSHVPYFFKKIPAAAESIIMLAAMVGFGIGVAYFYSFVVLKINEKHWQEKLISQPVEKLELQIV